MPAGDTELLEIIRTDLEMHGNGRHHAVMADDQLPVSLVDHCGGPISFRLFFDKSNELAYARVVRHTQFIYIPAGKYKQKSAVDRKPGVISSGGEEVSSLSSAPRRRGPGRGGACISNLRL